MAVDAARRRIYEKLAAKEALPPPLPVRKFVSGEVSRISGARTGYSSSSSSMCL